MKDFFKVISLFWKAFTKGDMWIYFGASLTLGLPFIEYFSMVFDLPYNTGSFDARQVFVLGFMWFFLLIVAEMVNYKINNKFHYNVSNLYWGLLGFGFALFLMR